ncbi:unnamed protein product [Ceratitis capitata]|uniref:(Mediterranean fruit fly) hypothetical protein n=1 Tax=Ceratitis capitata TaxID=7213 RepID=A0A811VFB9_CERCA|nr:unnamed protein product [Ceratitis capitata]
MFAVKADFLFLFLRALVNHTTMLLLLFAHITRRCQQQQCNSSTANWKKREVLESNTKYQNKTNEQKKQRNKSLNVKMPAQKTTRRVHKTVKRAKRHTATAPAR